MSTDPQEIIARAIQSARYNEAVVVTINENVDGNDDVTNKQPREIILVACLDSEHGGIIWKDAAAFKTHHHGEEGDVGIVRHLRTKRWVIPMLNDKRRNDMYDQAIRSACLQKVAEKRKQSSKNRNQGKKDDSSSNNDNDIIRILDIGSGTGLLAMMSAKHTLDAIQEGESNDNNHVKVRVTSVEMASAMARLARMAIKANSLDDNVRVLETHSMDENFYLDDTLFDQKADEPNCKVTKENKDDSNFCTSPKADICTSELLESGLLGEGVLPSIRDAWSRHLKDDAIVIPRRARVVAVLVETNNTSFFGPNLNSFKKASGVCLSTTNELRPLLGSLSKCGDAAAESNAEGILVSLHAGPMLCQNYQELSTNGLTDYNDYKIIPRKLKNTSDSQEHRFIHPLSEPQIVLDFEFASGLDALPPPTGRSFARHIIATNDGNCNGVLFWWELDVGDDGSMYSTKPIGFFGDAEDSNNWQDHWQQNLFIFGDTIVRKLVRGFPVQMDVSHNDTSILFTLHPTQGDIVRPTQRRRLNQEVRCISSTRALQLNDMQRVQTLHDAILHALETKGMDAPLLDLSDMGICAMIASAAGAKKVTSLESSSGGMPTLAATIAQIGNKLDFQIIQAQAEHVTNSYIIGEVVEIVAAEPYYELLEGWHLQEALNYFYLIRSFRRRGLISSSSISIPSVAILMAVVVEFEGFSSAYGQVGDSMELVAGFDHSIVNFFGDQYHTHDVSLPVFEYQYRTLSKAFCVAKLLYDDEVKIEAAGDKEGWASVEIERPGKCQAVMFYIDYLCRVPENKATHQKDELYLASISTASASHRQGVRKIRPVTVVSESDVQRGAMFFCKVLFDDDTNSIEDHTFEFKIVK